MKNKLPIHFAARADRAKPGRGIRPVPALDVNGKSLFANSVTASEPGEFISHDRLRPCFW